MWQILELASSLSERVGLRGEEASGYYAETWNKSLVSAECASIYSLGAVMAFDFAEHISGSGGLSMSFIRIVSVESSGCQRMFRSSSTKLSALAVQKIPARQSPKVVIECMISQI